MPKEKKNDVWVAFGNKIVYLYENFFNGDEEELILHFSDHALSKPKSNRKKTIRNWLTGKTKKPNGFYLSKFKINKYRLDDEVLLPLNAFKNWSLEKFRERIDLYLSQRENPNISNQMKYVYFFNLEENRLAYFEIRYPDPENLKIIELSSELYTEDMTYRGRIEYYNNISYISVVNQFDYMNFIFKNSVQIYKKEIKVFGVAQCIDALCGEPKAYMALLTSEELSAEDEEKYAHKLNHSNRIIADDFTHKYMLKEKCFLENFMEKIDGLARDISHYDIDKSFSKNMYFDIVLNEYKSYVKLLEKSIYDTDYLINNRTESLLFSFRDMCKEERIEAVIPYVLGSESISILDEKNPIMETQLELVKQDRLKLTYLFVIEDTSLLTDGIIKKIECIEENGIEVKIIDKSQTIYSKILWVQNQHFAIYKMRNQVDDNVHVTQDRQLIEKLEFEIKFLDRVSIPFQEFLKQHYSLDGTWYSYAYSSKRDSSYHQMVKFEIKNHHIKAFFPSNAVDGTLMSNEAYTLLLLPHSIIKIHNINIQDKLFRISIIGKERNMYHRDVLLFGLMSRRELSKEQVDMLLNKIHKKEDEEFRLKISDEFDSTLAYFNIEN